MTVCSPQILDALARGTEVVTQNEETARFLRQDFDQAMLAAGKAIWPVPSIFGIKTWMSAQWHRMIVEGATNRTPLSATQELSLWRSIVASDVAIKRPRGVAELAMRGWGRLWLFRGRKRMQDSGASLDTRALPRWARLLEERCHSEDRITAAELPEELAFAIERNLITLPPAGLLIVGFNRSTPAYDWLFQAIRNADCNVEELAAGAFAEDLRLMPIRDEATELLVVAQWIRRGLKENPCARLGVVAPDLAERRRAIERTLWEVNDAFRAGETRYVEFSPAVTLADTALAVDGLDLLRWQTGALPLDRVSALLLSPYFGGSLGTASVQAAAEFDALVLRRTPMLQPRITVEEVATLIQRSPHHSTLADLLVRMRAMQKTAHEGHLNTHEEKTYADWAQSFAKVLTSARWTRRVGDSELAASALKTWEHVLDELVTLGFHGAGVDATTALSAIENIAQQTKLAPQSRNAPVQVLEVFESSGIHFDAIWVMGAGDQSWFRRSEPNPLMTRRLQRELCMPEADPATHAQIAGRSTHAMACAAASVTFSYAEKTETGVQHASPYMAGLPLRLVLQDEASEPESPIKTLQVQIVADDTDLPALPDRVMKGGAGVMKDQAACPFRSFATHRLHSTGLETRQLGLDPRDRGNDVHSVMNLFWREVRSQSNLRAMTLAERREVLERSIEDVLLRHFQDSPATWDSAYLEIQRQRLRMLLMPWLEKELARPEFLVRAGEAKHEATVGPLRLNLTFDRIDLVDGSRELILDYKTGSAEVSEWLGERPDSPQLPLYALVADPATLGGIAFAELRAGNELSLKGFAVDGDVIGSRKNNIPFQIQVDDWHRVLTKLARDFSDGDARVDPKRYPATCMYCEQRLLCRLDVSATLPAMEEEAQTGE